VLLRNFNYFLRFRLRLKIPLDQKSSFSKLFTRTVPVPLRQKDRVPTVPENFPTPQKKIFAISYLSGKVDWGEGDDHAGLDDAGLHPTHGDCPDTADLVHIL
jgi:hypothetical protein